MSSNNIMSSPTISSPPSGFASRDALPNSQQQGSQAQGKEVVDSSQITFRFCRECSNMLYPKEDRTMPGTLVFQCRTCLFSEKARSNCIFRNVLNNADFETAGVVQDVATDTTVGLPDFCTLCGQQILCITCGDMLPRSRRVCTICEYPQAVFFQSQQRSAETGMKLFYVCVKCKDVRS